MKCLNLFYVCTHKDGGKKGIDVALRTRRSAGTMVSEIMILREIYISYKT